MREKSDEKSKKNHDPNEMLQSGLSTLKRIQSFDFDQALLQSEHAPVGSFLSSNGGG